MNLYYQYLSKYRLELMGLSSLWVVWFHSEMLFQFSSGVVSRGLNFLESIGYGGVDVFLLISGMGIYRSLQQNRLGVFYKHRAGKILPVWWTFLAIHIILGFLIPGASMNLKDILGFATFTGYWLNLPNQGNWYGYAIVLFYLIAPLLYQAICRTKKKRTVIILLMAAAYGISFLFFHNVKLMVFSRLPMFLVGMFVADQKEKIRVTKLSWVVSILGVMLGLGSLFFFEERMAYALWDYGLWWYPFIVLAPCLSLLVSGFFHRFEKGTGWLRHILRILGKSSFEILLATDIFFLLLANYIRVFPESEIWNKLALAVLGICAGILIHLMIEAAKRRVARTDGT